MARRGYLALQSRRYKGLPAWSMTTAPPRQTGIQCYATDSPRWERKFSADMFRSRPAAVPVAKGSCRQMTDATDSIRQFIFTSLEEMNYDTDDIDNDSELGPQRADL